MSGRTASEESNAAMNGRMAGEDEARGATGFVRAMSADEGANTSGRAAPDDPGLHAVMSERRQLIGLAYRLLGSLAEAETGRPWRPGDA